jgi:hypothetical protein
MHAEVNRDNGIPSGHIPDGLADLWPLKLQQTMWRAEDNGAIVVVPEERALLSVTMGIPPLTTCPISMDMETTHMLVASCEGI